jgi:hypothetical protein
MRERGDESEKKEVVFCVTALVASLQEITLCVVPLRWSHYSVGCFTHHTGRKSRETGKNVL